ncbi:MAG: cyclic nucleotide-binding domain-containing protein [Cyanobacteria bacterium SID2]|nr:cyclic nucleotide-binding domain-containing protein [Cyanobacteria bacterium SID2]MBP0004365.1 cyclic nucleotide-binding domain-containing protein [Cyanobacteria bacterium SBC]
MLEKFLILKHLSKEEIVRIESICEVRFYDSGDLIFQEGEISDELYFLASGKVNLHKTEESKKHNLKFKEISEGTSFGEMSFIDGSPRSCSIEAATPKTQVYVLSKQKFIDSVPEAQNLINIISGAIVQQLSDRLRTLNNRYINTLQKQIDELRERNNFASFLFLILSCLFVVTIVNSAILDFLPNYNSRSSLPFLIGYLVVAILIPSFIGRSQLKFSFREIGITFENMKQSLTDGIVFSIISILGLWGLAFLLDIILQDKQFLSEIWSFPGTSITLFIFFIHSYIQEVLRAAIQVSIENFLRNRTKLFGVFIAALLFGMFHIPYGTTVIFMTLVGSVIFGLIYKRTYNLLGVAIVHFVFGLLSTNMGLM